MSVSGPAGSVLLRRRLLVLVAGLLALLAVALPARGEDPVTLLYFGADGCPYCAQMEVFLDDLEERFGDDLVVERHDVSNDPAARDRWIEEMAARGQEARGVPTAMLDDRVWVGFDASTGARVEAAAAAEIAARRSPPSPTSDDLPDGTTDASPGEVSGDDVVVSVPFLGDVDVASRSAVAATALIAFIDGFNPCSLWVLAVLLAMVLNAGATRGRVALIGGVFLAVTGSIYGAFIAGVFTVMGFVEYLGAIRVGVAAIALFVGAVNVKDYFAYKKGLSFTIPDRFKPRIYRGGRSVRAADRPLPAVVGTTVAMAAGIALVELPCTAGFPVIWSGIMHTQGIEGTSFAGLLGLYLLTYVGLEVTLFVAVLVTLQVGRFEQRYGRVLKLLGGTVMLALGGVLLVAPELMENLPGATLVIVGAVVLAVLIDLIARRSSTDTHPETRREARR
jgi:thiol-disulfide isomerase/thioredoxin